jgi:hypothetical protein
MRLECGQMELILARPRMRINTVFVARGQQSLSAIKDQRPRNERPDCEAPRRKGGGSRARRGEQNVSQGNFIYIVPLDPAYKAGPGHLPVKE